MSALDQINAYVRRLEARFRLLLWSRGLAVAAVGALLATVLLAIVLRLLGFIEPALVTGRTLLYLGVALAVTFGLAIPLLRLNRRWAARRAERECPQFQERLLTLVEKQEQTGPFAELLAQDALGAARSSDAQKLIPSGWIIGLATSAGAAITILLWLVFAGPGFLGYGSAVLWGSTPRTDLYPARTILVNPGNLTLRRKAGQQITARLIGFSAPAVNLFARYHSTPKWDAIPMQTEPSGTAYQFFFAGLDDALDYYVQADGVRSKMFTLTVRDLPVIKALRVRYHYPAGLGLADEVEDPGGDLRAVAGTEADLSIEADRQIAEGSLALDNGARIPLAHIQGNSYAARVPIVKDGSYYIAAIDNKENVRLSDDYFIEARKDAPPTVKIVWPARDTGVNPVEEMTIKVRAEDDYGLKETSLHYSVNGGTEKSVSLSSSAATKKVEGKTTLYLEDFKLVPGDVVSYYAVARDAKSTVKSDMYFASAQPFDLRFSQAQASGAGGGMGDDDPQFSDREKEIIGATWNEVKNPKPETSAVEGRFLADMQSKLSEQSHSLAERVRARSIDNSSPEFKAFTEYMDKASDTMKSATAQLRPGKWNDALPIEQKALQLLLRAEAAFRDIRVAFGNQGAGGGGGGASNSARDLERLLDLELDTEKNQYETEQAGTKTEQAKKLDEALQKLKELARRQEELASQQRGKEQQFQQRWEQEMLRRQAEELRQQMEDMKQQGARSSQQQGSQQGSQQSSQQGSQQSAQNSQQSSQQGRPSSSPGSSAGSPSGRMGSQSSAQLDEALRQIEQAEQQMRAGNNGNPEAARRAAENLRQAEGSITNAQRQQAAQQLNDMARRASQLSNTHAKLADRMRQEFGGSEHQEESDPRFGPSPTKTTPGAKRLADEEEQLASELKALEQEMSETAKNLGNGQPEASSKLRQALGEAQESDLEMRMRKSAEWMRKGEGMYSWMREGTTSMGLDKLREQIGQAASALRQEDAEAGKKGAGDKDSATKNLEAALAQVEEMRKQLEQLRAGKEQNGAKQSGVPHPGQRPGEESSGEPSQGQIQAAQQEMQHGINRLRGLSQGQPEIGIGPDVDQLYGLYGPIRQFSGNGDPQTLADRLTREVLPEVERLETVLRRKLDAQLAENVRIASPDQIPEGYAEAIAEYYRRLSKTK